MTPSPPSSPPSAIAAIGDLLQQLTVDSDRPAALGDNPSPEMLYAPLSSGAVESGVWTCEPGGWDEADYPVDEVFVVMSGRLRLTEADGSSRELARGDMCFMAKGWVGRWDVLEHLQKIYFIVGEAS